MLVDALGVFLPNDPDGNAKLVFSILDCLPKANRVSGNVKYIYYKHKNNVVGCTLCPSYSYLKTSLIFPIFQYFRKVSTDKNFIEFRRNKVYHMGLCSF